MRCPQRDSKQPTSEPTYGLAYAPVHAIIRRGHGAAGTVRSGSRSKEGLTTMERQLDRECRADADVACDGDPAVVRLDSRLHNGEPSHSPVEDEAEAVAT
jgi:hypothetical protein